MPKHSHQHPNQHAHQHPSQHAHTHAHTHPNQHTHLYPNQHAHPHPYHRPVVVVPPTVHHHSHRPPVIVTSPPVYAHRRYSYYGTGVFLVGALLLVSALVVATILKLTAAAAGYAVASMTVGATAAGATGSALAFSAATFGIGALVLYGVAGLGFLCSSTKEGYSSDQSVWNIMKSRVVNEDGLSIKGILKSAGAVLWSPFLLIGAMAGKGAKAIADYRSKSKPTSEDSSEIELQDVTSYRSMSDGGLELNKNKQQEFSNEPSKSQGSLFFKEPIPQQSPNTFKEGHEMAAFF